ncbi:MAG: dTDP-4-dehydrorhamnose 3,5-epimerase [Alphaproteobacteria bacterium]|nr:dTDP-4-dehydrorhamnose 3,5-epimerase [Alphaproteobacteria bacterium]
MKVVETALPEVKIVMPQRFGDARGYFSETYRRDRYAAAGIDAAFLQDNHAHNRDAGVVRGLHFQSPPHWQAKLVRVAAGRIFAVGVDLRPSSPRFGRHAAATLTAAEGEQFYLPTGFAFGYCTLEAGCDVLYKVSDYYAPALDRGLAWDDPDLAIAWPVAPAAAILSDKDRRHPRLKDLPRDWLMGGVA